MDNSQPYDRAYSKSIKGHIKKHQELYLLKKYCVSEATWRYCKDFTKLGPGFHRMSALSVLENIENAQENAHKQVTPIRLKLTHKA